MKIESKSALVWLQGNRGVTFHGFNNRGAAVLKLRGKNNFTIWDYRKKVVECLKQENVAVFLDIFFAPAQVTIGENSSGVHINLRDTSAFPMQRLWLISDFDDDNWWVDGEAEWPVYNYQWESLKPMDGVAGALYKLPLSSLPSTTWYWLKSLGR